MAQKYGFFASPGWAEKGRRGWAEKARPDPSGRVAYNELKNFID
jgi:hypothetical protein